MDADLFREPDGHEHGDADLHGQSNRHGYPHAYLDAYMDAHGDGIGLSHIFGLTYTDLHG